MKRGDILTMGIPMYNLDTCDTCKLFNNGCAVTDPKHTVGNCVQYESVDTFKGSFAICDTCKYHDDDCMPNKGYDCDKYILEDFVHDKVNHPLHYCQGGIECIEAIKASMTPNGFQDYCKGNVLKYIWRWRDKAGVEDLRKASVYLNWLIKSAEKEKESANGS
mgnify:CR=1 FL=1